MKVETRAELNTGSGCAARRSVSLLRDILFPNASYLFRPLSAVLRTALATIRHARRIQRSADDVIANARQIFHATAADQHDRVLLQVVADAGNVGRDLNSIREPYASNLSKRRIRLLRGDRIDAGADAPPLRTFLQRRTRLRILRSLTPLSYQLIKRRHCLSRSQTAKPRQDTPPRPHECDPQQRGRRKTAVTKICSSLKRAALIDQSAPVFSTTFFSALAPYER